MSITGFASSSGKGLSLGGSAAAPQQQTGSSDIVGSGTASVSFGQPGRPALRVSWYLRHSYHLGLQASHRNVRCCIGCCTNWNQGDSGRETFFLAARRHKQHTPAALPPKTAASQTTLSRPFSSLRPAEMIDYLNQESAVEEAKLTFEQVNAKVTRKEHASRAEKGALEDVLSALKAGNQAEKLCTQIKELDVGRWFYHIRQLQKVFCNGSTRLVA